MDPLSFPRWVRGVGPPGVELPVGSASVYAVTAACLKMWTLVGFFRPNVLFTTTGPRVRDRLGGGWVR
jgi:hypothetical protein